VKQIEHQPMKSTPFLVCDGLLESWVSTRPAAELNPEWKWPRTLPCRMDVWRSELQERKRKVAPNPYPPSPCGTGTPHVAHSFDSFRSVILGF
jgi:hypothetical protein